MDCATTDFATKALSPGKDELAEMLVRMLRIRMFDEWATRLKPQLIPGFLHNTNGQEAAVVGACMPLRDDDYITGNHRSHGHPIGKGVRLAPLMAELFGRSTGVCRGKGGSMHLAAFAAGSLGESGIVGAAMPVAVGAALSAQLRGSDQVCLSFFGDGAANCGLFHESLNLAAIWHLPVIFFCENNGYAGCSPQGKMTAVEDVAARAGAYGMPGVVIDGQDVLAVHEHVAAAIARARTGGGPALLEAKTYRYCNHMEHMEFPPYRPMSEVDAWRERDPIELFTDRLERAGVFCGTEIEELRSSVRKEVEAAAAFARESAFPEPATLFEDVYA